MAEKKKVRPRQRQSQPGLESKMKPRPKVERQVDRATLRLKGKVALITGGDSGIGRAVAVAFAREGADVAIVYLNEHRDAAETRRLVEAEGRKCLAVAGDVGDERFCKRVVLRTVSAFGRLDILVNNAAEQHEQEDVEEIDEDQLLKTFRTNLFGYMFMTQAALPHLGPGASIINTTSVTAYRGHQTLVDYSATKGAIVSLTRSLSKQLA
ncbi:MAG: SDR family NAD(P)-dependent oxidoreductase, partial [Candidatus Binatia bacterium]